MSSPALGADDVDINDLVNSVLQDQMKNEEQQMQMIQKANS